MRVDFGLWDAFVMREICYLHEEKDSRHQLKADSCRVRKYSAAVCSFENIADVCRHGLGSSPFFGRQSPC